MAIGLVLTLVLIAPLIVLVGSYTAVHARRGTTHAGRVLDAQFVRGELSGDEYRARHDALGHD